MDAILGLFGIVVGVLLGKLLELLHDEWRRRRKEIDMVFALHAEISAGWSHTGEISTTVDADYLLVNGAPVGPADRTDFVFDSLKADLSILPQPVIHTVVRYYRVVEQANLFVDFLEKPQFSRQDEAERRRFAEKVVAKLAEQDFAAAEALAALERYVETRGYEVPHASEALAARLSRISGAPAARQAQAV
ncbi:hypothetical protein [Acuticoccus kandeliae]|uniref:hypothetical protein n=1 Tax=Acuticoccus kandeliae TaxID=2073160 RepID=UPI000D3E6193|nr:hypothetical protein [Acuticoccus kandeliae]